MYYLKIYSVYCTLLWIFFELFHPPFLLFFVASFSFFLFLFLDSLHFFHTFYFSICSIFVLVCICLEKKNSIRICRVCESLFKMQFAKDSLRKIFKMWFRNASHWFSMYIVKWQTISHTHEQSMRWFYIRHIFFPFCVCQSLQSGSGAEREDEPNHKWAQLTKEFTVWR